MTEPKTERRERPRLELRLNVEFLVEGEERQLGRMGTTENVSAGGIYFTTSEWQGLRVGQELGIRLSGLSGYGTGSLFRSLRARAKIVRLELPERERKKTPYPKAGVAVQFCDRPCFEVYRWSE